jgi:DNA-directed RNA polymerase specialized sigma24 family protein
MRRGPWRNGASWTPEEAAHELHRRRPELLGQLRRRGEGRGIPPAAQEEVVADAITAVVMSARSVQNERHLIGAFWLAVDHRARRWREGRHLTRLGSRQRVEFDTAVEWAATPGGPFEAVELTDRMARAADFMAQLDPREQRVVSVMASYGVGPVPAARLLQLPLGEVRAAWRSANAKLEQIAVISAAGRMCDYRYRAIVAHAAGQATASETTAARAHVNACVSCERVYRQLRREMRGREFQRGAVAAFLPLPAVAVGHGSWLDRVLMWAGQRSGAPRVPSERAAEILGGGGLAKAAAAGTAVVVAGGGVLHSVTASPTPHHHHARRHVAQSAQTARATVGLSAFAHAEASAVPARPAARRSTASGTSPHHAPPVPNRSSGYLALGESASSSSSQPRAQTASVRHSSYTESSEPPPQPTGSGGGSNLSYLGH